MVRPLALFGIILPSLGLQAIISSLPAQAIAHSSQSVHGLTTIFQASNALAESSRVAQQSNSQPPEQPKVSPRPGERVSLADGQISLVLPPGFTPLAAAEIAEIFSSTNPPQYAYGNRDRTAFLAVSLPQQALKPEQLPEFKTFFSRFLEAFLPKFEWVNQGWQEFAGQRWGNLEFRIQGEKMKTQNSIYFTSFQDKPLLLNLSMKVGTQDTVRPALLKSRDSLQLRR